jgi:hypothetical protein
MEKPIRPKIEGRIKNYQWILSEEEMKRKKILLIGKLDVEDGGYLNPITFVIPNHIKYYSDAIDWFKEQEELIKVFISHDRYFYDESLEEEVELKFEDLEDIQWEESQAHFIFDNGDNDYKVTYDIDTMNLMELNNA